MADDRVYNWKHGWIPLTHAAALQKAKGNSKSADGISARYGIGATKKTSTKSASADTGSAYSNQTLSQLIARRNNGDRGAEAAIKRKDYKKTEPYKPVQRPVSSKPGAPGVMDAAAYKDYSDKVEVKQKELQPRMDQIASNLPEPQVRQLLKKYRPVLSSLSIGIGQYANKPYPSAEDINTLAHANASVRALNNRVSFFDQAQASRNGEAPATPAQIAYIQTLRVKKQRSGTGDGFMTVRGDPSKLTKSQASAYINSLKGDY